MRNLKKFLALVLATLMIVSAMVATTVSAAEADHAGAVEFLNLISVYLGDGQSMAADQLVTRWQMALFVSRVTTGFTDDSAWANTENTTPFTDVETRHYIGAIACAYNAGVINGVGNNKFAPDANIKYQEALAMAVRALGYTGLSYPLETVQMAQKLGLTDNLNELDNKLEVAVTRGQIAEILQNTLLATAKDGTTLLESVFKMDVAEEAVVVATPKQALPGYDKTTGTNVTLAVDGAKITVAADLLLEEGETVEDLLGYSFTLATTNNYETVVNAFRCDSKVIKNLGTNTAIAKKDNDNTKIKIEGTEYGLGAIDVYTLGNGSQTIETKGYYYNLTNDIVDENGDVLLYYINGEYWKNISQTSNVALVKATDADFTAALSVMTTSNIAGTFAKATSGDAFTSKYAEMKLFDDNGDGKWDRAIYTPYTLAKITTASETNSYNAAGTSYGSTKKTVMKVDGTALANAAGNKLDSAVITFVGGKPANNEYVIYHYNPNTTTFTTVQNLGAVKTGAVSEVSGRGSYVTIDGTKYNYDLAAGTIAGYAGAPDITPAINALVNKTYNVKYLALGNYVLTLEYVTPTAPSTVEYTNYVVFSWSDVKSVDSNGNLVVNAIVDATGVKKEIKIAAIDNYKVGLKLADYVAAQIAGAQPAPNPEDKYQVTTGTTTPSVPSTINYANYIGAALGTRMNTNIYAGKVDANGVYTLTVDLASNKVDIAKASAEDHVVEFKYGINMLPLVTAAKSPIALAGKFDTTSKTVYLFVGADNYKVYTGVAPDGATIDLTAPGVVVYNATESFIFVTTTGNLSELIDTTEWAPNTGVSTPVTSTKSYFAVTANTYASLTANANEDVTLTVDNFYNVLTGRYEDVIVEGDRATLEPIFNKIITSAYTTVVVVDGDTIKIDVNYVDLAAELNNAGYTESGDLANNSGDKTGYTLKLESVSEEHLQSISLKVFWKDGTIQTIDGKEGYKFAGVDYAFYKVDTKGNLTGFVLAPNAKAE